ncbi:tetratricopeptide repeat protein [Sediminibacterium sp.]|uniref:tetratricopeptide repeat protein n=1 Tax=Sediminibacterium sp. TaxID=1917865 RepID=UPI00272079D3|nr:tetratricopeptide repeat protein [Sediminibacterium sp.]MDO9000456.1 tetratricopeptide repeat protein [Bacteroidota bacterium]MDP3146976.1 tetratricopeptide repeat protein [Bacteroidota bacterium]MDP3567486.1 tetratricopeptide repeat protein [Sediminibacterium sp.]
MLIKIKHIAFGFSLLLLFKINLTQATTKDYLDSVNKHLLVTKNIKEKLNCLYTLSYEYGTLEPRRGIAFAQECLALAKKHNVVLSELNSYNGLGNAYEALQNYDSAKYFHQKSYKVSLTLNDKKLVAVTLSNIAVCCKSQGEYKNALKLYLQAFDIFKNLKEYNPRIHFFIGEMCILLNDFNEAEKHSHIGIELCKKFDGDYIAQNMYVNLAKCYFKRNKKDSAFIILQNSYNALKNYTDKASFAFCLNTIGDLKMDVGAFAEAKKYYLEDLSVQQKITNETGICLANVNLACVGAKLGAYKDEVRFYLTEAEKRLNSISKNKETLKLVYFKIATANEQIKDLKQAFIYYKKYSALNDLLLNEEKILQLKELRANFEILDKERKIKLQETELGFQATTIKEKKLQIVILIFVFVFVFLIFVTLSYRRNVKRKIEDIIEKQNQDRLLNLALLKKEEEERARIAKDIHDELGSDISKISLISEYSLQNKNNIGTLTDSMQNISKISKNVIENMRDLVWTLNSDNNTLDFLSARIYEYGSEYLDDLPITKKFDFDDEISSTKLNKEACRNIFLVFKEALNNCIKHAGCSKVEVEFKIKNNHLYLKISDNGTGFDVNNSKKNGVGLSSMRQRIEKIKGIFNLKSTINGSSVEVKINLHEITE